jgi:hypothetical protein
MPEHGDLLVGQGAFCTIVVIAESVIFLVFFFRSVNLDLLEEMAGLLSLLRVM